MSSNNLISANDFCISHKLEISFIYSLREYGLIELTTIDETDFLLASQLEQLERITRLYTDLGINIEGIETVTYLLERLDEMEQEIISLRNRLSLYE